MDHEVKEIELPNGAKSLLVDVKGAKVMRLSLSFMGGELMCPPDKPEIAHALEHMVLKANRTYREEKDFVMEICKNGADVNAATGAYSIEYTAACADFEWRRILELLASGIADPLFSPAHFKTEMKVISEELTGDLDDYAGMAWAAVDKEARPGGHLPEERVKLLDNVTLEDLKRFYGRTHSTANMRFVAVGDLGGKERDIERIVGRIELKADGRRFKRVEKPFRPVGGPIALDRPAAGKTYFQFWSAKADGGRLSLEERVCLNVLYDILIGYGGAYLASRINGQARDRGLTYGIDCNWVGLGSGYARFYGSVEKANAGALFELIASEIRKILDGGLDEKEIEAAKRRFNGILRRRELNTSRLLSHYGIYADLDDDENCEDYDADMKLLPTIGKEQVLRTCRLLFSGRNWYLGLVGPSVSPEAAKLHEIIGGAFKA